MSEDPQLASLRQKLLSLCPELEKQIKSMSKADLRELISMSEAAEEQKVETEPIPKGEGTEDKKRSMMIQQLCQLAPDILNRQELKLLSYQDIEEIYQNYKESPELVKKKQEPKKSESRKRKIIENGEVNVYEMKKILIDKLPQYRNDIRNLADDEIRRMYKDLQEKNQNNEKESKMISKDQSHYSNYQSSNDYSPALNPGMNHPSRSQSRSSNRLDEEESYYQAQSESAQGMDSFRRRGRPKKIRDHSGFTYDDAPNYGGNMQSMKMTPRSFEYKPDFPESDYNSNFSKFQNEVQKSFSSSSYDDGQLSYRSKASVHQGGYQAAPLSLDYPGQTLEVPAPKHVLKQNKIDHNYSDLDSDSSQEEKEDGKKQRTEEEKTKIKERGKKNRLAKIIESMQEAFAKKPWKIQ